MLDTVLVTIERVVRELKKDGWHTYFTEGLYSHGKTLASAYKLGREYKFSALKVSSKFGNRLTLVSDDFGISVRLNECFLVFAGDACTTSNLKELLESPEKTFTDSYHITFSKRDVVMFYCNGVNDLVDYFKANHFNVDAVTEKSDTEVQVNVTTRTQHRRYDIIRECSNNKL